jgi:hypothetical protein
VPDRAVTLRIVLAAAGLALAFGDAWWFHTDAEYGTSLPANAAFAVLALFLVVVATAPLKAWPFSLMAVILLPLTFAGLWLGGMWASCDLAMRPSILQMIFYIGFPGTLLARPPYAFGVVAVVLCVLAAARLKRLYAPLGIRAQITLTIALAAAPPSVAATTYGISVALGIHPTHGNCVI